jgi:hypothetical protein
VAFALFEALIEACLYRRHIVLTDNGIQFAELPRNCRGQTARYRVNRSTRSAGRTTSSIGSPSQNTHEPMAKSSA